MPREEVEDFYNNLKSSSFSDPITGVYPTNERELSGILAAKHQLGKVDWTAIKIYDAVTQDNTTASRIILSSDIVLTEYPLFAKKQSDIDRWGQMAPDLVFLDEHGTRLAFIESKVDSHFTHSDEPPNGQVSRYIEFLSAAKSAEKTLIITCPYFNYEWYRGRVERAIAKATVKIPAYVMVWEDVFPYVGG